MVRGIPLLEPVGEGATLAVDSLERAWVGGAGAISVLDSVGRPVARIPVETEVPARLLWTVNGSPYARAGDRLLRLAADSPGVAATRRAEAPYARDPRGRWIYTATRGGSILGLDPVTLQTRWGWPDVGSRVTALAVSPYGDRVYAALAGSAPNEVEAGVEVRDAISGRPFAHFVTGVEVRALEAGPAGTLYALAGPDVLALRHGPGGLTRAWAAGFGRLDLRRADALRVSPTGERVAVLARGEGGGVRILDARTGLEVGRTDEAPLDVAFDFGGRLWMLGPREIRVAR